MIFIIWQIIIDIVDHPFRLACEGNHLNIVQWLLTLPNLPISCLPFTEAFKSAVRKNSVEVAEYMNSYNRFRLTFSCYNYLFHSVCQCRTHLEKLRWIFAMSNGAVDIHDNYHFASFRIACRRGKWEVVQ